MTVKTMNDLIEELASTRDELKILDEQKKELNKLKAELEETIYDKLDEQEISRIDNGSHSVSINYQVVPQVEDWDLLYDFVADKRDFQLFQRRLSAPAYRELLKSSKGVAIPGVVKFTQRRLNIRSTAK